jgi:hypothetical protein
MRIVDFLRHSDSQGVTTVRRQIVCRQNSQLATGGGESVYSSHFLLLYIVENDVSVAGETPQGKPALTSPAAPQAKSLKSLDQIEGCGLE